MIRDYHPRQGGRARRRRRTEAKARVRQRSLRKERLGATREGTRGAARAAGGGIAPALRPPAAETRVQTPKPVRKQRRTRRLRLEDARTRRPMLGLKSVPRPAWLKMRCPSPSCSEPHLPCRLPPAACRLPHAATSLASLPHSLTHPLTVTRLPT
jgi:hypothetical protein